MLRCTPFRSACRIACALLAVMWSPPLSSAQDRVPRNSAVDPIEADIRVLADDTGRPISGATVEWLQGDEKRITSTDVRGAARISVPAEGEYPLHISADDRQKSVTFPWVSRSSLRIPIRLRAGGEIRGAITDSHGQPVSGVDVSAALLAPPTLRCDATTSGADGRYVLRGVPTDQPVSVRVSLSGYERAFEREFALNGAPYRPLDFLLVARRTAGDVQVQVVDHEGRSIAGARIANHGGNSADVISAFTNDDGKCALQSLYFQHGNRCELLAQADGYCPSVVKVPSEADRGVPLRITLEPGHRIQGRVVTRDGAPVSGAIVEYGDRNFAFGRIGGQLRADPEGRFFSNSLPAKTPLRSRAPGFEEWSQAEIAAGGEPLEIVLLPPHRISGTVINSVTQQPITRFNVRLNYARQQASGKKQWAWMPERWTYSGRDYSSSTGQFTWPELQSELEYELFVSADGYESRRTSVSRPGEADEVIALKPVDRERLVAVSGRILNQAGEPLEGVVVHLMSFDPGSFPKDSQWAEFPLDFIQNFSAARDYACRFDQVRVTAPDGRFEFPMLLLQDQTELVYWGEDTAPVRIKELQLLDQSRLKAFEIVAPVTARIVGSIDAAEFPNPSEVWANNLSGPIQFFPGKIRRADGKVTYSIGGLPEGKLAVRLLKPPISREDGTIYVGTYLDVFVDTTKQRVINCDFDKAAKTQAVR